MATPCIYSLYIKFLNPERNPIRFHFVDDGSDNTPNLSCPELNDHIMQSKEFNKPVLSLDPLAITSFGDHFLVRLRRALVASGKMPDLTLLEYLEDKNLEEISLHRYCSLLPTREAWTVTTINPPKDRVPPT